MLDLRYFDQYTVEAINAFKNPKGLKWSVQGMGMLRTELDRRFRLQIWHPGFKLPGTSCIHTHPWDFQSVILGGAIENITYAELTRQRAENCSHFRYELVSGPDGGLHTDTAKTVKLVEEARNIFFRGDSYGQIKSRVHETLPDSEGAVTLIAREKTVGPADRAYTYTELDKLWVDAKPRPATEEEIFFGCNVALRLLTR